MMLAHLPHASAVTLARDARSGNPVAIAEYLGGNVFDGRSRTSRSVRGWNERDYQEFVNAVKSGRLQAVEGVLIRPGLLHSSRAAR